MVTAKSLSDTSRLMFCKPCQTSCAWIWPTADHVDTCPLTKFEGGLHSLTRRKTTPDTGWRLQRLQHALVKWNKCCSSCYLLTYLLSRTLEAFWRRCAVIIYVLHYNRCTTLHYRVAINRPLLLTPTIVAEVKLLAASVCVCVCVCDFVCVYCPHYGWN